MADTIYSNSQEDKLIKQPYILPLLLQNKPQARPQPLVKPLKRLRKPRRRRFRRFFLIAISLFVIGMVILFSQGNGSVGAWLADTSRAVLGPTITAQIESWYLGLTDTAHRIQYQLNGQHVVAPWKIASPGSAQAVGTPAGKVIYNPMPLTAVTPLVTPPLDGEGVWTPLDYAAAPYNYIPIDAKMFIRPDPSHPYAVVTLLQFDTRFSQLHIVAGTTEPGGPLHMYGPGVIPAADQKNNALLAVFNGGFKYADGQYGLKVSNVTYVPHQPNAATIAITKSGKVVLGAWGVDPLLNDQNTNLVAWRQNAALLIDRGMINPLTQDGAAWGGTILNKAYTWRSGIGITANNTLVYAAGDSLTAETLAMALKAAGAVMAMQTDINPFWVRAFLYHQNGSSGPLSITKLNPAMQGTGQEYLYGTSRDFFYLTRAIPASVPTTH